MLILQIEATPSATGRKVTQECEDSQQDMKRNTTFYQHPAFGGLVK